MKVRRRRPLTMEEGGAQIDEPAVQFVADIVARPHTPKKLNQKSIAIVSNSNRRAEMTGAPPSRSVDVSNGRCSYCRASDQRARGEPNNHFSTREVPEQRVLSLKTALRHINRSFNSELKNYKNLTHASTDVQDHRVRKSCHCGVHASTEFCGNEGNDDGGNEGNRDVATTRGCETDAETAKRLADFETSLIGGGCGAVGGLSRRLPLLGGNSCRRPIWVGCVDASADDASRCAPMQPSKQSASNFNVFDSQYFEIKDNPSYNSSDESLDEILGKIGELKNSPDDLPLSPTRLTKAEGIVAERRNETISPSSGFLSSGEMSLSTAATSPCPPPLHQDATNSISTCFADRRQPAESDIDQSRSSGGKFSQTVRVFENQSTQKSNTPEKNDHLKSRRPDSSTCRDDSIYSSRVNEANYRHEKFGSSFKQRRALNAVETNSDKTDVASDPLRLTRISVRDVSETNVRETKHLNVADTRITARDIHDEKSHFRAPRRLLKHLSSSKRSDDHVRQTISVKHFHDGVVEPPAAASSADSDWLLRSSEETISESVKFYLVDGKVRIVDTVECRKLFPAGNSLRLKSMFPEDNLASPASEEGDDRVLLKKLIVEVKKCTEIDMMANERRWNIYEQFRGKGGGSRRDAVAAEEEGVLSGAEMQSLCEQLEKLVELELS